MAKRRILLRLVVRMREVECVVEEERLPVLAPLGEILLDLIGHQLRREINAAFRFRNARALVLFVLGAIDDRIAQRNLRAIAHEEIGVAIVRVTGGHVAVGMVEALLLRIIQRKRETQPILADDRRRVARLFQHLRNRQIRVRDEAGAISPDATVPRVQPGHQHASRRGADGAACIMPREPHAFRRHAVHVRRGQRLLAVAAGIPITHVIREDEDDVRPVCRPRSMGQEC